MSITIRLAESAEDLQRVYRLRYAILVEEMGVNLQHADHVKRTVCEPLDARAAILAAYDEGAGNRIVASSRINFGDEIDLGAYVDWLHMRRFGSYFPQEVSLRSRFMVVPELRGTMLTPRLFKAGYELQLKRSAMFDFSDSRPDQVALWSRYGYRPLLPSFVYPGDPLKVEHIPLVMALRDHKNLARCKSPLKGLLTPSQHDDVTADFLSKIAPALQ